MRVAEAAAKSDNLSDFPISWLYELTARSVPEAVREEIVAGAVAGARPRHKDVAKRIAAAKPLRQAASRVAAASPRLTTNPHAGA
jgi:hypothetical protein